MTGGAARGRTTPEVVAAAASRWPDAEAVVDGALRITFAQLKDRVDGATRGALAAGLQPGDRAAVWAPNSVDWMVAALGLQGAGVAVVPLNTRYKGAEAADVLLRSGARALFTVRGFLGTDYPALLDGHQTRLERVVVFGEPSWEDFCAARGDREPPPVGPDDLADIIFTSGTTGRPKGVMTAHGQTVAVPQRWCDVVGLRAGDRYLVATPFFHTFGYRTGFVAAIHAGRAGPPDAGGAVRHGGDRVRPDRVHRGGHHVRARRPARDRVPDRGPRAAGGRGPGRRSGRGRAAGSPSPTGSRTCSSSAASTPTRPRSRRPCWSTRRSLARR